MKYVKVNWVDSHILYGWHDKDDSYSSTECVTVGILVANDKKNIVVALSESLEQRGDSITIPKGCVKKITYLEEKDDAARE